MKLLTVDGIDVIVEKKRVKNLNLRITRGGVLCSVPMYVSYAEAEGFIRSRAEWIKKKCTEMGSVSSADNTVNEMKSGDRVILFGEEKEILFVPSEKSGADLIGDTVVIRAQRDSTPESRKEIFSELASMLLREKIEPMMSRWENVMGVEKIPWTVRKMKTRWGTCHVTERRIWFSVMLSEKRNALIEYVVVHELCHLFVSNHGEEFKALMTKYLPEWKELRRELNNRR